MSSPDFTQWLRARSIDNTADPVQQLILDAARAGFTLVRASDLPTK